MRVLWFSNTPANSQEFLMENATGGGWLQALDKEMQQKVELHVAFYYRKIKLPFAHLKTVYHPIQYTNFILQLAKNIFFNSHLNDEDLDRYLEIVERVQPDIIHIHGTENSFGCILSRVKQPVVVSIQGLVTVIRHKYFSGMDMRYAKFRQPAKSIRDLLLQKSLSSSHQSFANQTELEIKTLKQCLHVIGRTDWDRRVTSVLAPLAMYHHSDEIMRKPFYENGWAGGSKKFVIHTTTSGAPYKGFYTICQAIQLLLQTGISFEWQVAGLSEQDLAVRITRKSLGVQYPKTGLKLLGHLDSGELVDQLLSASLYVMSSHIENSPNNLCEAMLLGLPCVATYAGGTPSILTNNQQGLLVQDGDPWALVGAILELHRNPELAKYLAANARQVALKRHDPGKIVDGLIDVYNRITFNDNKSEKNYSPI